MMTPHLRLYAAVVAASLLATSAAMGLALRVTWPERFGATGTELGRFAEPVPGYATFAPLSPTLVATLLGDAEAAVLLDDGPRATDGLAGADEGDEGEAPAPPEPPPSPSAPPRDVLPPLVQGDWDLEGRMQADKSTAEPEESIIYTVVARNIGTQSFAGELQISSHHPFGTRDDTEPCVDPGDCARAPAPVPGLPGDVHTVSHTISRRDLAPGEEFVFRFRVRVNAWTPSGTELRNHAHIDVTGDGEGASTTNTTVVTVE